MENYSLLGFRASWRDQEIIYPKQMNYTIHNLNKENHQDSFLSWTSLLLEAFNIPYRRETEFRELNRIDT